MADIPEKRMSPGENQENSQVRQFVDALDEKHRMLVVLKSQLYDNRWEPMLEDLHNRLEGKPYIFKLVNRIKDDMERIDRMRQFESDHNVDLSNFVHL